MRTLTIGKLAAQAEVAVDTVRYYERRGVLPRPSRRGSGYREYPPSMVERIRLIKSLQGMGFNLDEVIEILGDVDAGSAGCERERPRVGKVLFRLDERIHALQRVRRRLTDAVRRCDGGRCAVPVLARRKA
jgi:MerR family copper efflux transcriptional regulator